MSNEITRVYQFLAKYSSDGTDIANLINKGNDNTITKADFIDFMEENFEWDGETTEAGKNDIINTFWKSIDTNRAASTIKGTKFKNANALDNNELEKMQNKIEMYEILNDFTAGISAPSMIASAAEWKAQVVDELGALVEAYAKEGKDVNELLAYLQEKAPAIQNTATAEYAAAEYLNSAMKDVVKEYGYAFESDSSLKSIIENYVATITEDDDPQAIQDMIINIVDAYLATAGLKEDNALDLSQFGYNNSTEAKLNDLQTTVLNKKLTDNLADIKNEANYEKYSNLYDTAITQFINDTVNNAKVVDFETIGNYGVNEFKQSEAYKNLETTVSVKNIMTGDELYNSIKTNLTESLAEKIKVDGRYYDILGTIEAEAIEKATAGEFGEESIDTAKLVDWITQQITQNVAEFYPDGLGDLPLEELGNIYDILAEAATNEADDSESLSQHRDAAKEYCNAITHKNSSALNEAIVEVFGDDYDSAIGKMMPSEIQEKIEELKEKASALGDPNEMKDHFPSSYWSNIPNTLSYVKGSNTNYQLPNSVTIDGRTITTDRMSFAASNSNISIDPSSGLISINGDLGYGTYQSTIKIMIDGIEVASKTVSIKVEAESDIDFKAAGCESNNALHLIDVAGGAGYQTNLPNRLSGDKETLNGWINELYNKLIQSGQNLDPVALATARDQMIELYSMAMDKMYQHCAETGRLKRGKGDKEEIIFNGQRYNAYQLQDDDGHEFGEGAGKTTPNQSVNNNDLGIALEVKTDRDNISLWLNTDCVMAVFEKLYQQALS